MMRIALYALPAVLLCMIGGCTDAIYFYETEKIAVNLEGRPDATKPISGTIGVNMHVAAVVPKKDQATGDALSLISYFNFEKTPGQQAGNPFDDVFSIETVMITGAAQKNLKTKQLSPQVFSAMAGLSTIPEASLGAYRMLKPWTAAYIAAADKTPFDQAARDAGLAEAPEGYAQAIASDDLNEDQAAKLIDAMKSRNIQPASP